MKLKASDHAAVSDEWRVRTCWVRRIIGYVYWLLKVKMSQGSMCIFMLLLLFNYVTCEQHIYESSAMLKGNEDAAFSCKNIFNKLDGGETTL